MIIRRQFDFEYCGSEGKKSGLIYDDTKKVDSSYI